METQELLVRISGLAGKIGYFMWSEWDVPRQMKAKLATESLYISSIVLLPSPSPLSITVLMFFI
jgi:hypothetical protein